MNTSGDPCHAIFLHRNRQTHKLDARLTVRLLVPRARTWTTELLGLAPPVIGNKECAVILDEGLLELVLRVLIDVFLVVGDDGFGNGLADGVDLGGVTTARDAHADVNVGCKIPLLAPRSLPLFPFFQSCIRAAGVHVPNLSTPRIRMGS